ncbi:family A G protein-coupled receptor-like protein [Amylostereum chailletii]|nr:family A G protein-coupled receptor-like protein [Amylostereum chailletii]
MTIITPAELANKALGLNPPNATIHQSTHDSDWLWAVFSVMMLADLLVIFGLFAKPRNLLLHQLSIIILSVSGLAYFSMASNLGHTPITVEWSRGHGQDATRDIWYVRYIQWFINAPLVLLITFIGTGFPLGSIFSTLFMADFVVIAGLVGALVHSTYKWGYFSMGVSALFYIVGHLFFFTGRQEFPSPTGRSRAAFMSTSAIIAFLWLIYPLVWALCDGSNVISPTGEMVWFGIMDLLAGPCWIAYFLFTHRDVEFDGATPVACLPTKA